MNTWNLKHLSTVDKLLQKNKELHTESAIELKPKINVTRADRVNSTVLSLHLNLTPMKLAPNTRRVVLLGLTAIVGAFSCFIFLSVKNAQLQVNQTLCSANLTKLHFALHEYQAMNGTLPPAFLGDSNGRPRHSWRVLMLPHLDTWGIDGDAIQRAYNFNEPWNSSANLQLIKPVEESRFACPCGDERKTTKTNYVVPIGEGTLFPGANAVSLSDLPNDVDPIMVFEIAHSNIQWAEPRDLPIADLNKASKTNSILLPTHGGIIRYVTVNGRRGVLPPETSIDELKRLCQTGVVTTATEQ